MSKDSTTFVGLDVHKDSITVARQRFKAFLLRNDRPLPDSSNTPRHEQTSEVCDHPGPVMG